LEISALNDNSIPEPHDEHEEYGAYKHYPYGGGHTGNGRGQHRERDMQGENMTGALPALGSVNDYAHIESPEFEYLIQSLRTLFEHDRQVASQSETTRCGICYLYFSLNELRYREEGFYVCTACEHALGKQYITMLHRQQKL
jgi:hypothetical protein